MEFALARYIWSQNKAIYLIFWKGHAKKQVSGEKMPIKIKKEFKEQGDFVDFCEKSCQKASINEKNENIGSFYE